MNKDWKRLEQSLGPMPFTEHPRWWQFWKKPVTVMKETTFSCYYRGPAPTVMVEDGRVHIYGGDGHTTTTNVQVIAGKLP